MSDTPPEDPHLEALKSQLAERLTADGIDPERVLSYGVPAVLAARGDSPEPVEAWFAPLEAYVRRLHAAEVQIWDAVSYGVRNLARVCGPDLPLLTAQLDRFAGLLITLQGHGAEFHRLVSYGIGAICELIGDRLWALEPLYRMAERCGASGGDPGWMWQVTGRDWTAALLGPPEEGDAGREAFERSMDLLGGFLEQVDRAGMSAGSRLSDGLGTLARYGRDLGEHAGEWLDLILALIGSMHANGMSPYLPIGNGLGGVAGHVAPRELSGVLRFAVRLADLGIDPGGIIYEAFTPLARCIGTDAAIEIGRRLAEQGFDPFFLMRDAAAHVGSYSQAWPEAAQAGQLEECLELLVRTAEHLHAVEKTGRKYFMDSVPYQAQRNAEDAAGLLEALRIGEQLASHGVSPGMTVAYGWPTVQEAAEKTPWIAAEGRAVIDALCAAKVDPEPTLSYAFPVLLKVADGDREAFGRLRATLTEVVTSLAAAGVDPRDVLYRDVSAMADVRGGEGSDAFQQLLEQLRTVLAAMREGGVSPARFLEAGLPAAARAATEQPWRLDAAFAAITRMAKEGRDGTSLLEHAVAPIAAGDGAERGTFDALLAAVEQAHARLPAEAVAWCLHPLSAAATQVSGGDPAAFGELLDAVLDRLPVAAQPEDAESIARALPELAEIADGDRDGFLSLVDAAVAEAARQRGAERYTGNLLFYGLRAVARVTPGRPAEAVRCLAALSELLMAVPPAVGSMMVQQPQARRHYQMERAQAPLEVLARLADTDAEALRSGLAPLGAAGRAFAETGDDAALTFGQVVETAAAIPPGDAASFVEQLEWLTERLGDAALRDVASRIAAGLAGCRHLIARFPSGWSKLIRPALLAHGPRAAGVLQGFRWLGERVIRQDSDLEIIAEIATQTGVRAMEILDGLVVRGVHDGVIRDLTAERAVLSQFIREVPLADPQIYRAYRDIQQDEALSEQQRRAQVETLQQDLQSLSEAVRSGEVTPEQERAALFPLVLYYVFPPAMSSSRDRYLELYRRFDDHADHVAARDPGELRRRLYALRQGAWEMRPGAELDRTPWELVTEVVAAAPEAAADEPLEGLGWDLLGRWSEGRIGREQPKREMLTRVLARARLAGIDVPRHADTPAQLLACKEFLGDHVRDVVEQALIAARQQDETRYDRMVHDKLAPDTNIGAGLVKSMWQLAQALAAKKVPAPAARKRLEGQLRGFIVDFDRFAGELESCKSKDDVKALLLALPVEPVEIEHGKEQSRLLADFIGQELTAMQRELFGAPGHPAKLVYRISDDAPALELTCELTKRKAHAPIGICEGVCVSTDEQLWNRPEFFQVIFWGPDHIAAGGMHLLIVRDGEDEYVTLPGINPSMRLLNMVEPRGVLDLALDYAWRLAKQWGCKGVWVPTAGVIFSNRRHIHQEVARRDWPTKGTGPHQFSYSPYSYSFSEVFVVPGTESVPGTEIVPGTD